MKTFSSIVITGASSGIGEALALDYAVPGAALALTGRDVGRLESVAAACRAKGATVVAEARAEVMRKGIGNGASAVMRLTTNPGQITLTPMPSFFRT